MDESKYQNLLRRIASLLARRRAEKKWSFSEMEEAFHIREARLRQALLAEDWHPSLKDIAKIEAAVGRPVLNVGRRREEPSWNFSVDVA